MGLTSHDSTGNNDPKAIEEPSADQIRQEIRDIPDLDLEAVERDAERLRNPESDDYIGFLTETTSLISAVKERTGFSTADVWPSADSNPELMIENLVTGMNDVVLECRVKHVNDEFSYGSGDDGGFARSVVVEDESGSTQVTAWDECRSIWDSFGVGDRLRIEGGSTGYSVSDYMRDRFGVPAVSLNEGCRVARLESDGSWRWFDL